MRSFDSTPERRLGWPLVAVLLGLAALTLIAEPAPDPTEPKPPSAKAEATATTTNTPAEAADATDAAQATSASPTDPGLRAYLDPETGELTTTPTLEQRLALDKAMAASLSRSAEGLETFKLRQGGVGVHLRGRFQSSLTVHRHADGTFAVHCIDHPADAAHEAKTAADTGTQAAPAEASAQTAAEEM